MRPLPELDQEWIRAYNADALEVHRSGSYVAVLLLHLRAVPQIASWHLYALPQTVALFLFGAWIWRSDILHDAVANKRLLKVVAWIGCLERLRPPCGRMGGRLVLGQSVGSACKSLQRSRLHWATARSSLLSQRGRHGQKWLAWAAPVGRMAFTNYLAQSVIFALIFFGYGLGMFNRLGVAATLAMRCCASTCCKPVASA